MRRRTHARTHARTHGCTHNLLAVEQEQQAEVYGVVHARTLHVDGIIFFVTVIIETLRASACVAVHGICGY